MSAPWHLTSGGIDAAWDKLTAERGALLQELTIIATADPRKWDEDTRDQFREWAQNRARAAIDAARMP